MLQFLLQPQQPGFIREQFLFDSQVKTSDFTLKVNIFSFLNYLLLFRTTVVPCRKDVFLLAFFYFIRHLYLQVVALIMGIIQFLTVLNRSFSECCRVE